ncbi:FadR/GntR family transcriptional regulator [Roseomonas marmotae]|uniref:FadR family transcriptional regulator n=1 Tax=Roseomonas marmotae TaxID=2768161 RepID=A0ABS3KBX9_9PROT|nr:FCD domain-containing protein [Roseomonas marmotae]MBO1074477.1 FadR family transcriptional regulator [Roseomonas marmotae]QTI78210.1 FadR family transcriptional regulator [Roseomonas marmotae]
MPRDNVTVRQQRKAKEALPVARRPVPELVQGIELAPLSPPANLTAELVRRLAAEIRAGRLSPGDRLPTEQALMRQAGVSRTVVREAVSALRAEGLVTTRQGVGAFVADPSARGQVRIDPAEMRSLTDVLQVIELRIAIESEAAGLAAARRGEPDIERIQAAADAFALAVSAGDSAVTQDLEFHRAIFAATGNGFFPRFLEFLGPMLIPRQTITPFLEDGADSAAYLSRVRDEHARIAAAIAAGQPGAARSAMRRHLTASRDRYARLAQQAVGGDQ